ncbi:MAG: serine hydrolase domain-containing protein [Bacteroidales bacterium]
MKLKSLPISVILMLLAFLLINCQQDHKPAQPQQDSLMQAINRYLEWEGENGFNGVILVKTPGNDLLIRSFGYANEEQLIPNTPQTAFDIGSLTKQFTGAAVLKLEMQGKLSVTDSIGKYLPALGPDKRMITFHQLLTHSSGLPTDIVSDAEVITKEDLLNKINETPLISQPGSGYHYSHAGYNLLGLLIEAISGTDYENYLQANLFKPSKMRFTGYRMPDWTSTSLAHGYRFCNDWGGPMDAGWLDDGPSWNRRASGGMLSTIIDLYVWHEALLGNEILDEPSKVKYYYPAIPVIVNDIQSSGYGWRIIKTQRQTKVIAHNGWNGRYYSDFLRYLDEKVTIILLSNKFRDGNQNITYEIAKCIFRKEYQPRLTGCMTQCIDSLPDNRLGRLGGKFLTLLANGVDKDFKEFTETCLASHLIIKFGKDTLVSELKDLQKRTGPLRIRQIMITDNQRMNIEVIQVRNNQEAFIQLYFDKNEDYKIRGFKFESPDERH